VFSEHLFLRPSHCHYYFGDYYAVGYYDAGFLPAHSFHVSRRGYDPIYARAHWQHRHDLDWGRNIEARFVYRREHEEARPPRTLSAQIKLASNKDIRTQKSLIFAESLWKVSKSQSGPTRFRPVDAEERKSLVAKTKEVRRFGVERQILETGPAGASRERSTMGTERGKVRMPASPILAKKGMSSKAQVLPPQPQLSELDTTVEPKPRKSAARRESTEAAPVMQKKSRVEPGTKPTMGLKTKAKPNEEAKDNPGRDANRDSAAAPKGEPNESKIESKNKAKKGSKAKQESKSKEDEP
jgi:hypothetical protein